MYLRRQKSKYDGNYNVFFEALWNFVRKKFVIKYYILNFAS